MGLDLELVAVSPDLFGANYGQCAFVHTEDSSAKVRLQQWINLFPFYLSAKVFESTARKVSRAKLVH